MMEPKQVKRLCAPSRWGVVMLAMALLVAQLRLAQGQGAQAGSPAPASKSAEKIITGSAEARLGVKITPLDFKPPQVNHATLSNGITLDHFAEPTIPLVTILVGIRVGSVNDPEGKVGAAEMTGEVIRTGGTARLAGDELDRQIESRGAQISVDTSREQTWFRLSALKEDLPWALDLLTDLLTHPALPEAKLEEARARTIVGLRQRLDTPMDVAQTLYPQLVYGYGNPWGWTSTEHTVKAITVADLRAIFEKYYVSGNIKLGLCGDVTWADAQRLAEGSFGKLDHRSAPPLALPAVKAIEQTQVYIAPREVTQNVVYFGHLGVERFSPFKFPIKVFNNVLSGGFTSRLFKEIRSDRGLAYAVFGQVGEGTQRGVFQEMALTKVESTGQVLNLFHQITDQLTQEPPAPAEVELASKSDVNAFVFFFDTPEKIVQQRMFLDLYGYPPDYLATYTDKLQSVTPQDVQKAAAASLHPDRAVVLVVGAVGPELRAELQKMGPITEITEQELRAKWM